MPAGLDWKARDIEYRDTMFGGLAMQRMARDHRDPEVGGDGFLDGLITAQLEAEVCLEAESPEASVDGHPCSRPALAQDEAQLGEVGQFYVATSGSGCELAAITTSGFGMNTWSSRSISVGGIDMM